MAQSNHEKKRNGVRFFAGKDFSKEGCAKIADFINDLLDKCAAEKRDGKKLQEDRPS